MQRSETLRESMSLEEKVGQLLHVGIGLGVFETETNWPSEEMREFIEAVQPGAVRIYGGHAVTPYFMARYANTLQEWAADAGHGVPLLLSTDGEYGAIDVVRHGTQAYPTLMGRTATGDVELARDVAGAAARDMLAYGLNMSHQPVVDVNTNPENPVIGVRSPGADPETVSEYASAVLEGIHGEEQIAVAKHFPGHGDTELDSHHDLPHVTYDRGTLEREHLPPFERMIEEGVDCVMTSHIVVDCLDPEHPATLSEPVLTGLLREELGFDGVVVTDAMMMDAISDNYGYGDAAVRAVDAGVDLLLTGYRPGSDILEMRDALVDAVEAGDLAESRIDESVERILALKDRYDLADRRYVDPLEAVATTGRADHRELAAEAYERSLTVFDDGGLLPLDAESTVLLTGIRGVDALEPHLSTAFDAVLAYSFAPAATRTDDYPRPASEPDSIETCLETLDGASDAADVAVVPTYVRNALSEPQRRVVETLAEDLPVVVVSLGLPTEREKLPDDVAHVATYLQDRLGMPEPVPDTLAEGLVEALRSAPDESGEIPLR